MVIQHGAPLRVEIQAQPGHIPLNSGDGDSPPVGRAMAGVPNLLPADRHREQDKTYTHSRQ
ncbi:Uncharacterised protein [Mycobacteroides abscessus subsp. abscessus]|nr:Uncharacterised protein [Mycobacteroides abscessus subsp. abscessus]